VATVDFTAQLRELEAKRAETEAQYPPLYKRVMSVDAVPCVALELYVNVKDDKDIYFSTRSACVALGLSANWLSLCYLRPSVMSRLVDEGFSPEKRFVNVLVGGKSDRLTKPCIALDRKDFDALLDYAAHVVKKPEALALYGAFMLTGLNSVAGFNHTPAEKLRAFEHTYTKLREQYEAKSHVS